jgi:hypothetical protein
MSARTEQRSASRGAAVGMFFAVLVIGTGLFLSTIRGSSTMSHSLDSGSPLPGGTKVSIEEATAVFPVPVFRPNETLASDQSIAEAWVRTTESPEVYVRYRSGMTVLVRPIGDLQPTRDFADAQVRDGVPGEIVDIGGVETFLVPQTKYSPGSVRFVMDGVVLTVIGHGDFSVDQLRDVVVSVISTSDGIKSASN